MSARSDRRRDRELPFSRRERCSEADAAAALGVSVRAVRALVAGGALRVFDDGMLDPESVINARSNLTQAELEGEI
jgi:hypothetical protein